MTRTMATQQTPTSVAATPLPEPFESEEAKECVECIDWTAENEVKLFTALRNRRPVGTERFFEMVIINDKLNELLGKEVPSKVIWDHLDDMYDMDTLNDNNSPPPELMAETDFHLGSDFEGILQERKKEFSATAVKDEQTSSRDSSSERTSASVSSNSTSRSQAAAATSKTSTFAKASKGGKSETPSSHGAKREERSSKVRTEGDDGEKMADTDKTSRKPSRAAASKSGATASSTAVSSMRKTRPARN